jgi:tRNA1Val (adenine37-N6)-methyltransferase
VEIRRGDLRKPELLYKPQSFSVAVFNPPYRRLRSGRMNLDEEKAAARHEIVGTAADFIAAAGYALRPGGRAHVIYPATRMVQLLARMREFRIEPKRLQLVHPFPGGSGVFVVVEGVKGGREGMKVLPPLYIHEEMGGYTREMKEIFRTLSAFPARDG